MSKCDAKHCEAEPFAEHTNTTMSEVDGVESEAGLELKVMGISKVEEPESENVYCEMGSTRVPQKRYVHLDLKGAPPRPAVLMQYLHIFAEWGATGVIFEWEDMLPYDGRLKVVRNQHCYSSSEVIAIVSAAEVAGLDVIPLVQTFGHLEFVLKHAEFEQYREDPNDILCLCPLTDGSQELAKELIHQTLRFHPSTKYIHIGCDEVYSLGTCSRCSLQQEVSGAATLFLDFVAPLVEECRSLGVRALLWHDMFENFPAELLQKRLADCADPVVWNYSNLSSIPPEAWRTLSGAFKHIWGASAFKGACEPDTIWVPVKQHVMNHLAWLDRAERTDLHAIIITGWSRFNHTAALCEILPVAIPSLCICLTVWQEGEYSEELRKAVYKRLGMWDIREDLEDKDLDEPSIRSFPGADIINLVALLQEKRVSMVKIEELRRIFCPPFTSRANPSTCVRVRRQCESLIESLTALRPQLFYALSQVLFPEDAQEFVNAKLDTVVDQATTFQKEMENLEVSGSSTCGK